MEHNKFRSDLTTGSVSKQLLRFSFPFLLSNLLQALYSVADMIIVGQFSGTYSITGVSMGSQISMLVTGAATGLAVSGTVLVAQYGGAKKFDEQRKTIGTMSTLYLVLSVVFTVVMLLCGNGLLRLLNTPEAAFEEASRYLLICMSGTVFILLYNAISAVLRGMGDSKRPLYFVAIAAAANVILDLVLVGPLQMGAAGAAIATVFSQALSVVLSLIYLVRNRFFEGYTKHDFRLQKDKAKALISIGLPSSVQQVVVSISFLTLTSLVNSLPNAVTASACQGIASRINSFAILPALAMSSAVSSMAGQNIGAGEYERAKKTMHSAILIALGISAVVFAVVQLFPGQLISIFSADEQVIATGIPYLRLLALEYLLLPMVFCMNGLVIAAGKTSVVLFNALLSGIFVRVPMAYILVHAANMGFNGVGLAIGTATIASLIFGAFYIRSGRWKKPRISIV